jgi:hypothetical protein
MVSFFGAPPLFRFRVAVYCGENEGHIITDRHDYVGVCFVVKNYRFAAQEKIQSFVYLHFMKVINIS